MSKKEISKKEVNLSRRYILIGFFASYFLFKQKVISTGYQFKGTSKVLMSILNITTKTIKLIFFRKK
jgi:hypothetical protein